VTAPRVTMQGENRDDDAPTTTVRLPAPSAARQRPAAAVRAAARAGRAGRHAVERAGQAGCEAIEDLLEDIGQALDVIKS